MSGIPSDDKALTECRNKIKIKQQIAFCEEYAANGFNGTQAAIAAGYSEKTAKVKASQLLTKVNVKQYVDLLISERAKRTQINGDSVLRNIQRLSEKAEKDEKYNDALKGQELLGKHLKLFTDKMEVSGTMLVKNLKG